jgi:peptidoglycan/LPS O-acetylase OafA/YrhL
MKQEAQPTQHVPDGARKRSAYIPTLDGWRAIAIFWVLLGHSQEWSIAGFSNRPLRYTADRGVQLFFALSGYLICTRLLSEERRYGSISLRSFYTRRLFRIQPAALTYLAVVSLLMLCGAMPRVWSAIAASGLMIRNFFPRTSINWQTAHFWSLAVEEHFYLFLPGFLVLCRRYRLAIMAMLVVAFEIWRVIAMQMPSQRAFKPLIYLRTDMVIGTILLGSVFALALWRPRISAFAKSYLYPWIALLYTAAVFARVEFHHSRSDPALLITVYPLLIAATLLHPASLLSRFLELAPLRFIGRISYSLYLWQELFFDPYVPAPAHSLRSHTLFCWGAAFACAIASYYLIETPLIRRGHRIAKRFDVQQMQELKTVVS